MKSPLKIIKSEAQYQEYMEEMMQLISSGNLSDDSDDLDRFELLAMLIERYEDSEHPIDKPTPIEAIKFRMDQMGLTQKDMTEYLGSKSKVSEVLSGKKPLTLPMIKKLHEGLGIPAEILISEPSKIEWSLISDGIDSIRVAFDQLYVAVGGNDSSFVGGSVSREFVEIEASKSKSSSSNRGFTSYAKASSFREFNSTEAHCVH